MTEAAPVLDTIRSDERFEEAKPPRDGHHRVQSSVELTTEADEVAVEIVVNRGESDPSQSFPTNEIRTSKYTPLTFLPVNLFEQFRRLANFYFILVVGSQLVPGVTPFPLWTSVMPLVFILGVSAIKEGFEDYKRHLEDREANERLYDVVQSGSGLIVSTQSKDIVVGDIVRIEERQEFPADMIVLATSRSDGSCYINTAALDGEAAPKIRASFSPTMENRTAEELAGIHGVLQAHKPHQSLDGFLARMKVCGSRDDLGFADQPYLPLADEHFLFRGASLHNTAEIFALVVYTGSDTKLMLNRNKAPFKFSSFERLLNRCVAITLGFNLMLCALLSILAWFLAPSFEDKCRDASVSRGAILAVFCELADRTQASAIGYDFLTYFILFSFMIPMSLYVTMELVKVGQAIFIEWDARMTVALADAPGGVPHARVRSTDMNEELGQVDYVFTDKTGTLTRNRMELSSLSLARAVFYSRPSEAPQGAAALGKDDSSQSSAPFAHASIASLVSEVVGASVGGAASTAAPSSVPGGDPTHAQLAEDLFHTMLLCNSILPVSKATLLQSTTPAAEEAAADSAAASAGASPAPAGGPADAPALSPSSAVVDASPPPQTARELFDDLAFLSPSPDEVAFVEALHTNGMALAARNGMSLEVQALRRPGAAAAATTVEAQSAPSTKSSAPEVAATIVTSHFEVEAVLQFSATRARMTVIVRDSAGNIKLLTKGADSAILPRVRTATESDRATLKFTERYLQQSATSGSRTLIFAARHLSTAEFTHWRDQHYTEAVSSLTKRDQLVQDAFSILEKDLTLLGCTSVDDQLQDGVPETVDALRRAGIKVTVLTGDKRETAVTIGRLSRIIRPEDALVYLDSNLRDGGLLSTLSQLIERLQPKPPGVLPPPTALVVNGTTLEVCLTRYPTEFITVYGLVSTIVCNRATPAQKALLVAHVRAQLGGTALAIGDGANDVSMIQGSNVGIGVLGKEGTQAALVSDYVIHRFRHLAPLLLIHGRYSFLRTSQVVLFSFFKNMAFPMPQLWFSFFSGFTGQTLYDGLFMTMFNIFFTALPPFMAGLFERDVEAAVLLRHPEQYASFRSNSLFTPKSFVRWLLFGLYYSLVLYFTTHLSLSTSVLWASGTTSGLWLFGAVICTSGIIFINFEMLQSTKSWSLPIVLGSFAGWLFYLFVFALYEDMPDISPQMAGMFSQMLSSGVTWLVFALQGLLLLAPTAVSSYWQSISVRAPALLVPPGHAAKPSAQP